MDIKPTNQQPISDDQELAKVLAGINQQADEAAAAPAKEAETTPIETPAPAVDASAPMVDPVAPTPASDPVVDMPAMPIASPVDSAAPIAPALPSAPLGTGDLDSIKQTALGELRPLVDKLDVSPEEKFDTYLLLLRSTDDKDLIAPAHEAARNIADEARRAKALLDIIKEIDYLSGAHQQPSL